MKGDIAFVGFMLTADEWQELDPQSRAQLIAVATRRADSVLDPPRRFPEGTGKHEILDIIDADDLLELDADDAESNLEPVSSTPTAFDVPSAVDAGWEDAAASDASQDAVATEPAADWEDFADLNDL